MLSAKLIKALEKKGFVLEFPDYESNGDLIIEALKEHNPRINLSLPLFFDKEINYSKIASKLTASEKKELNKIIAISKKIYQKENIDNNLGEIIKNRKIKAVFSGKEFNDYYSSFKENRITLTKQEGRKIEKQAKLRLNLDLNKCLEVLFSPAKIRIMEKIFHHEKLTNTELKYYYKSISSINKAVLNPGLQDYLRIIELTRKISDK